MKKVVFAFFVLASVFSAKLNAYAAFEMNGMVTYNFSKISPRPTTFVSSGDGIGYAYFGRLDLGPGMIESGFLYAPTEITFTPILNQKVTISGSYWILPLMYRYYFFPPFFSVAAGLDYALVGNTAIVSGGTNLNVGSSGYKSHFGAQVSLSATQDLGENLAAVLDLRIREGIGNAIYFANQSTKYSFWIVGLGLQKHFD